MQDLIEQERFEMEVLDHLNTAGFSAILYSAEGPCFASAMAWTDIPLTWISGCVIRSRARTYYSTRTQAFREALPSDPQAFSWQRHGLQGFPPARTRLRPSEFLVKKDTIRISI